MTPMTRDQLAQVEAYFVASLGPVSGRASVTFVGTEQVEVLRLAGPSLVTYATLGMSRHPMSDPTQPAPDLEAGPRAELVLRLAERRDEVFRRLAVLAMSPWVEGLVVTAGASLDLGEELWDGASFTAVLVGEPAVAGASGVQVFPLLPMTPNEAAWRRVHGSPALQARWEAAGTNLADPSRATVDLS
jgi:Suppressor of fused protein (SUFU)